MPNIDKLHWPYNALFSQCACDNFYIVGIYQYYAMMVIFQKFDYMPLDLERQCLGLRHPILAARKLLMNRWPLSKINARSSPQAEANLIYYNLILLTLLKGKNLAKTKKKLLCFILKENNRFPS